MKIITVLRKEIADQIAEECECNYIQQNLGDNKIVYSFIESDKLYKLLNNKKKYSRKDWSIENRMRF